MGFRAQPTLPVSGGAKENCNNPFPKRPARELLAATFLSSYFLALGAPMT